MPSANDGIMVILSSPSGAGKTTLVNLLSNQDNFKISIKEILKNVSKKTKIVFLANPNNPTGTYISKKKLLVYLKKTCKSYINKYSTRKRSI